MKKIMFFVCISIIAALTCNAAENAQNLLKEASAKLRSAKSVVATCRISANGAASNTSITMSGNKFTIKSADIEVWFDGKNQWTYSPHTGEVNLTEPTEEELSQTNPLSIIDNFTAAYTTSMLPQSKNCKNIRLTAKSVKSDISTVDISLISATLSPETVAVRMKSGEIYTITVTSLKFGTSLPESYFTYNKNLHPEAELIDLR